MYNRIAKIINQWDPANLLCCGCPNDEYEMEIYKIIEALKLDIDAVSLARRIENIFEETFENNLYITKNDSYKIAVKCLNSINNKNDDDTGERHTME